MQSSTSVQRIIPHLVKEDDDSDDDGTDKRRALQHIPSLHVEAAPQESHMGMSSPATITSSDSARDTTRSIPSGGTHSNLSTIRFNQSPSSGDDNSSPSSPDATPIDTRLRFEFMEPPPLLSLRGAEFPAGVARPAATAASAPTTPATAEPTERFRRPSLGANDEPYGTHLDVPPGRRESVVEKPKPILRLDIGFGRKKMSDPQAPPAAQSASMVRTATAISDHWGAHPVSPQTGEVILNGRQIRRIGLEEPAAAGGAANTSTSWRWYALMAAVLIVVIVVTTLLLTVVY